MEKQTNLITFGMGIREVVIPAEGNNVTIPLQIIIKETTVERMKVLHQHLGTPGKLYKAPKLVGPKFGSGYF